MNRDADSANMSEENVYKQKFEIAQWPTSKVVLFPTRATIFREIQGVRLKVILKTTINHVIFILTIWLCC
jgi:hypothetical protein